MDTKQLSKNELRKNKRDRKTFSDVPRNDIYIILDSLKVSYNIGTIIRLSDALLMKKVYICGNTIIPPNRKIKTSSRGAERWVPWEYVEDVVGLVKSLKKQGIKIVSAEIANNSIDYKDLDCDLPIALVLGREFDGVNPEILELSDYVVHLPMLGMSNSINVSTTASVLMYEYFCKFVRKN